jgi:HK97 family phage prohead protease
MRDRLTFAAPDAQTFDRGAPVTFAVGKETRTIKGLAVPFGVVGNNGFGSYRFSKGSLDWTKVKYLVQHEWAQAVGVVEFEETDEGLLMTAKVARGARGDEVLTLTEDGVYDGLSIGLSGDARFDQDEDGVWNCLSATVLEVSATPLPAFESAQVRSVAASAAPTRGNAMECDKCGVVHAHGVTECDPAKVASFSKAKAQPAAPEGTVALSAADIGKAVSDGIAEAFKQFAIPAGAAVPGATPPAAGARPVGFQVNEGPMYRFDGVRGRYDFSSDLIAGMGIGSQNPTPDAEAYARVLSFMAEQLGPKFVTTTDTGALNPTGYRPEMYVNEQQFTTPLRDALYKGALTDITPFTFPKFSTASGTVGDHTQGVEPTAGSFSTANGGTVTPTPVSGKLHITREVGDQGGNPQVSALLWNKMVYDYLKALEAKVAALLAASAPAELGATIAQGANTVTTLAVPLEQAIAGLNFIAGGNRYSYAAAHIDLYLALAGLKDGQNRPYFPIINPVNANGSTNAGYKSLDVAGTRLDPVWSLGGTTAGATPAAKSYLIDPSAVWFWHTAPTRLDRLQEKVEGWDLGIWGYQAGAISDITGVKKITYDLA